MFKQRQVDLLTKSSLRLPMNRTVVYIQRGPKLTESYRNEWKGIERKRVVDRDKLEWNRIEWKERERSKEKHE